MRRRVCSGSKYQIELESKERVEDNAEKKERKRHITNVKEEWRGIKDERRQVKSEDK